MTMNSLTIGAVGLALDVAERRAEVASHNVARANMPGARMERADFASSMSLLEQVAGGRYVTPAQLAESRVSIQTLPQTAADAGSSGLDDQVAEMAMESAHFQALSEALNRQFGLMSIALSGDQA